MKPIEYLHDLVGQSNFTTIGYTFQDEKLKDEFISKLPCIRYKEIDSSSSLDICRSRFADTDVNRLCAAFSSMSPFSF